MRSIVKAYNRAGAPSIVDLGFDAQPENDTEEDLRDQTTKDLIGFPGERAPHISFGFEGERWRIRNIVWVVSQSPAGQQLLDQTYRAGYRLGFDSMACTGEYVTPYINTTDKVILLDSRGKNDQLVCDLALQLGFASAAIDGVAFDHTHTPPAALLAHRQAAAYAHAVQLQICYELRSSTTLPAGTNKENYWRLIAKAQPRLSSGFAQAAINDLAISQGNAGAVAVREFYDHAGLRASYDAEVINYFRSLPSAYFKDAKAMIGGYDPTAQALKLRLPLMVYALNHEPKLNLHDPRHIGADAEVVQAIAALQVTRKNAGAKDKDSWQIKEVQL
jgi:hypothetical protein